MPNYKRATLQDEEGPEPAGDGSTSPDSVEVSSAPAPPSFPSPSSLAPILTLWGLPATKWAVGAGLGAKPDMAVPRDVLGVSQNAALSVPGRSSFLVAWGGCQHPPAARQGWWAGMPWSPHPHAATPGTGEWREGSGGSDARPPMVRWQVLLLLPRWGSGRGRGRC